RVPHPGRDVPVNVAYVVPGLVLPHLGELHALAAEYRLVLAAKHGLYPPACTQLDEADLSQHLAGHGLGRTGVPVWFWARGDDGICAPLAHVPRRTAARAKE